MRTVLRAAALGVSVVCVASLAPVQSNASSHREAPLIAGTPGLDNTDLYAFVSPDMPDTVTMVASWQPFEEPNGGPNFYPFLEKTAYDINIDNNGDAKPDITYRWTFRSSYRNAGSFLYNTGPVTELGDGDLNFRQSYSLDRITPAGTKQVIKSARVAPSFTGKASMPNYGAVSDEAITAAGKVTSFAGQSDDPFFADLRVFDLLYGGDLSEVGEDTLKGYNVNTIALRVPKGDLALKGNVTRNPVVGIWSTTSRIGASMKGKAPVLQQVSRLGMPLVNEAVIPVGRKNEFNVSKPATDAKFGASVISPEVPKLIEAIYQIPAPATPRKDLVEVFLTGVCKACGPIAADLNSQMLNKDVVKKAFVPSEQLRLNMAVPPSDSPHRLGVIGGDLAGFPNGRRLADDVIDVTLQAAEGILLPNPPDAVKTLGDGVNGNSAGFRATFPYVALPNQDSVNKQ
ncbi:DUF4331 domain-containing protein [Actinoplanes couchii]|uniref:DUF4331 domain-containing protein n=1 Tax=Actinoplanes couchii TaxID=403638 RepID=A0ABQ3X036_9ACTN|nr:DUF4331 domain-containing protein [Actinoplanes couchii]MDR6316275.1 hypothetical protein [Actinoplanes couchii]GID51890.1 hypothetical protein Aco03nite_002940 [Actinoplanes couchii]